MGGSKVVSKQCQFDASHDDGIRVILGKGLCQKLHLSINYFFLN